MNNPSESTENIKDKLSKAGTKAYSTAVRTSTIGCISSLILALLAVLTLFIEGGDSAGPRFFIFSILALGVLVVSGAIAVFISLAGIVNDATTLIHNKNLAEESTNSLTKNVGLILGTIFLMIIVFKLLKNW